MKAAQNSQEGGALIACHECDLLHHHHPIPAGGKALCIRCGSLLYPHIPDTVDRSLALNLAALILFIVANSFSFLTLSLAGHNEENVLISGALALYQAGMGELSLLVFLTSILFPLLTSVGMLYILVPLKLGFQAWGMGPVFRVVLTIMPWSLVGVLMLGVLIAFVKLQDIATVVPGIAVFALAALLPVTAAANANLNRSTIWEQMHFRFDDHHAGRTAAERGLVSCHSCGLLSPQVDANGEEHRYCHRCGGRLHSRKVKSLSRSWALVTTAAILLIPANLYPIMTVTQLGQGEPDTIFSGVVHLIEGGMWPLAMIVFFASIVVPLVKLAVLSFLMISIQYRSSWRPRDRVRLYRFTEVVGAWSMVDIFLIAILTALVDLGQLSTITPEVGATYFGAAVVATILAAQSFDPRLIWDNTEGAN